MPNKRKRYAKYSDDLLIKRIINKQLKPFGVKWVDLIGIEDWYIHFEVSEKDNDEWVKWGVDYIIKHSRHRFNKKTAKGQMSMLALNYGLKIGVGLTKKKILIEKQKK